MIILIAILFLSYSILCLNWARNSWVFILFVFILVSVILRTVVELKLNADYPAYLQFVQMNSDLANNNIFVILFNEPYFFYSITILRLFTDSSEGALLLFYIINFIFSTIFFAWLARLKDISFWRKVFAFSFFYFLFTYTTIRNTPAYLLVGVLFYRVQREGTFKIAYLSFLAHMSSIPALVISLFKVKYPKPYILALIVAIPLMFLLIIQIPVFNLLDKFTVYSEDQEYGQGILHLIYLLVITFITVFVFFYNRRYVYNDVYILLYTLYIFLFFISPVIAFRFSVYLVLFLIMFPKARDNDILDTIFNKFGAIVLLILLILNFKSNHPNFNLNLII